MCPLAHYKYSPSSRSFVATYKAKQFHPPARFAKSHKSGVNGANLEKPEHGLQQIFSHPSQARPPFPLDILVSVCPQADESKASRANRLVRQYALEFFEGAAKSIDRAHSFITVQDTCDSSMRISGGPIGLSESIYGGPPISAAISIDVRNLSRFLAAL